MRQAWYVSHAETIAQNVAGQALAFIILWAYGVDSATGLQLQATFLVVAYLRGYAIRRAFDRWGPKCRAAVSQSSHSSG